MSLHLPFVLLAAGEALGDALGRPPAAPVWWDGVTAAVRPLLPDADVDDDELTDQQSGVGVTRDPLTLVVTHGFADDDAAALVLQVLVAVERATGLTAYDPLTGEPVLAGGVAGLDEAVARAVAADDDGPGLGGALLRAAFRSSTWLG